MRANPQDLANSAHEWETKPKLKLVWVRGDLHLGKAPPLPTLITKIHPLESPHVWRRITEEEGREHEESREGLKEELVGDDGCQTLRVCTKHLLHLFPCSVIIIKPIIAFQITQLVSLTEEDEFANWMWL